MDEENHIKWIESLKAKSTGSASKEKLKSAIIKTISKPGAVLFSGGVDSSLIALLLKKQNISSACYTVGFQDNNTETPLDIISARKIAKILNLDYKEKIFNLQEAENMIKKTVQILPKPKNIDADFVVKVGVGVVVVAAASITKEKTFYSGLGSEEIFAGYDRHSKSKDINLECWSGLKKLWKRDLIRDYSIAKALKIKLITPFLDENIIVEAMKFDGKDKINNTHKKIILREIAEELSLPKEFAWRKKLGAQYGSKFDKAIEKLAKKYKFKTKGDYLASLI